MCMMSQMNNKLLSLNEENETLSIEIGDNIYFKVQKRRGVLQLEGVPQLWGIRYILCKKVALTHKLFQILIKTALKEINILHQTLTVRFTCSRINSSNPRLF